MKVAAVYAVGVALALVAGSASSAVAVKKNAAEESNGGNGTQQPAPVRQLSDRENHACTVALCMAAPNGWQSINQCIKPVEDFLKLKNKPTCPFTSNSGGGNGTGGGGGDRETNTHQQVK